MPDISRRGGQTCSSRLHVPHARHADVGRAFGARNGIKEEIVRTLQTTDRAKAHEVATSAEAAIWTLVVYLPDFTIPYRGLRFISQTDVVVAPDTTLLHGGMVLPRRGHHHGKHRFGLGLLSAAVAARRPDGRKLFAGKLPVGGKGEMIDLAAAGRDRGRIPRHAPRETARQDPARGIHPRAISVARTE